MANKMNDVATSTNKQEEERIKELIDAIADHVRRDHFEEFKQLIHKDLLNKYDDAFLKTMNFYTEEDGILVFNDFRNGSIHIEGDKAIVTKRGINLIQVFKQEDGQWKWCGRTKRKVEVPECAQGFMLDADTMSTYTQEIQDKLKSIVAYCSNVFHLFKQRDYPRLQRDVLIEYQTKSPLSFRDLSIVKFYMNNLDQETSRAIQCIHLNDPVDWVESTGGLPSGPEAVVSFEGLPVLWYLVTIRNKWAIRRIIDLSNPEFNVADIPNFYFKASGSGEAKITVCDRGMTAG